MNSAEQSLISFHRTRDGFLAACVGERAFLAFPSKTGGVPLASARHIDKPPGEWRPSDFYIFGRLLEDEVAFRNHVEQLADHQRRLLRLDRRQIRTNAVTPWGMAQMSWAYEEGVVCHSTASHGGFHLDEERNALVHPAHRNADGFYEEDGHWAKVAATFPRLFTDYERKCADEILRDWEPDAYEIINKVVLDSAESRTKDARQFRLDHGPIGSSSRPSSRDNARASSNAWRHWAAIAVGKSDAYSCPTPNMIPAAMAS